MCQLIKIQVFNKFMLAKLKSMFCKKNKELEYIWHATGHCFDKFDDEKVGSSTIKYGWGIYFSYTRKGALEQNGNAKYLYRIPNKALSNNVFLHYSNQLVEQDEIIKKLARKWYGNKTFSKDNFYRAGQGFYNDIFESERQNVTDPNGCAAKYLRKNGISGGIIDGEASSRIIVLYDTSLWSHAECIKIEDSDT